jgi:large subunit ribosomal protein L4
MIEIPVYNTSGEQTGSVQLDEAKFGGEVRPALLKQAYVRYHANRRPDNQSTKTRSDVEGSTRKLYKQKGTGNARRGDKKANILRGGGHAKAKVRHSWRQDMPAKMRKLANRNALLAKAVDGEIRLVESYGMDKPSTKAFAGLIDALKIDRTCLVAFSDTRGPDAKSAANLDNIDLTQIDRLNAFDLLNHRYLVAEKAVFEDYIARATASVKEVKAEQEVAA